VELDGRDYHEQRYEEDRDRDATLLSAGLATLRITPKRIRHEPDREAARLKTTLAARAAAH
jgi:very-short-patch-repair endonuclease